MNASEIAVHLKELCNEFVHRFQRFAMVTGVDERGHCHVYISSKDPCLVDTFDKLLKHRIHTFTIQSVDEQAEGFSIFLRYYKPIGWATLIDVDTRILRERREPIKNPVKFTKKWLIA